MRERTDPLDDGSTANRFKVEFTYDGQSRMRIKRDYSWSAGAWANAGETRYLYDGMLIVQERSSANAPTVTYTRGRDLSGSLSGAGGIGGLLARSSGYSSGSWSTHDFYHADGNPDRRYGTSTSTTSASIGVSITAMVNASGTLRAYYRYNPFGRFRASGGAIAGANTMRFSSKPWVAFQSSLTEGLYYYGYRFYEPNLQRWLNRDPIQERGGVNLYCFVLNKPGTRVDSLGLWSWWDVVPFIGTYRTCTQPPTQFKPQLDECMCKTNPDEAESDCEWKLRWAGVKDAAGGVADGGVQTGVDVLSGGAGLALGSLNPVAGIAVDGALAIDAIWNFGCDVRNIFRTYNDVMNAMKGCKCPTPAQ